MSAVLAPFRDLDRWIASAGVGRRTLDPRRDEALSFEAIATRLDFGARDPRLVAAIGTLATELVRAVAEHFPENLFADYAALVDATVRAAELADDPPAIVRETGRALVDLQALFGRRTAVRFRYVHDFLYGYDWAKWVQRDPEARAHVGPYAMPFLRHMLARGAEMLDLIAADDATYPKLHDARPRNPFRFDREPASEVALHRALAARDALPVRAWRLADEGDACGAWSSPYQELRLETARALGLTRE